MKKEQITPPQQEMPQKLPSELPVGRAALAQMIDLQWIVDHGRQLLIGICLVLIGLMCVLPLSKKLKGGRSDYLTAESAFAKWSAGAKNDLHLFQEVQEPLARHPELEAKFGTLIAQRLLGYGETKEAERYAKAALMRTKTLLSPHYAQFAQNTLLISQGKMKEALESAYLLKKEVGAEQMALRPGATLYAYNLLRIAALEREVGTKQGELAAWEEFMSNAGWVQQMTAATVARDPEVYQLIAQSFQSGEVSLYEYIQERIRLLRH